MLFQKWSDLYPIDQWHSRDSRSRAPETSHFGFDVNFVPSQFITLICAMCGDNSTLFFLFYYLQTRHLNDTNAFTGRRNSMPINSRVSCQLPSAAIWCEEKNTARTTTIICSVMLEEMRHAQRENDTGWLAGSIWRVYLLPQLEIG